MPYPGLPVSGSGLRAWGLGEGLRSRGHDVGYAMPAAAVPAGADLPASDGPLLYREHDFVDVVRDAGADVLVVQHWPRVGGLAPLDVPIALDLHGPLMVETAFQRRADADLADMARIKLDAFRRADFITCAGEHQRRYFLAWLMLAGIDVITESVAVIPVSFPPDAPEHDAASGDATFVYGGMFLPWQDPSLGLSTLVAVLEAERAGHLDFFGAPHPMFPMDVGVLAELEERMRASDRVTVHGLRPRDELLESYRHAHVALDLMQRNNERDLAFTTRTVEYLWCGLPVIYGDYGELAPLIQRYEAGWVVSPDDGEALAELLRTILRDPGDVTRRSANAQRLVRERLDWGRTIEPLDEFCRAAARRPRPPNPRVLADQGLVEQLRAEVTSLGAEVTSLGAELHAIRSTKTFRALEPLRRLYARLRRASRV